jgi:hypothetical protein
MTVKLARRFVRHTDYGKTPSPHYTRVFGIARLNMKNLFNVGQADRVFRLLAGAGLGISAIFVVAHPYARWSLTLLGIAVILSGTCGI